MNNSKYLTACINTIIRDFENGQRDKVAGYYDKWYRYNRRDAGEAYDNGFNSVECNKKYGVHIIECIESSI